MGEVPGCNLIPKSTTLYGGSPGSSSGETSTYSKTTRGRSKSGLTSSSRVGLASQLVNCPYIWTRILSGAKYRACPPEILHEYRPACGR